MKRVIGIGLAAMMAVCSLATLAAAADRVLEFPVQHAMESDLAKERLTGDVQVYMKGRSHPGVQKELGEFKSNKRSNGVGKSDQEACDIAFISAMIALQERALKEGGDGVVDITSLARNTKNESAENYSCVAGSMMVNVVLKGTVAKLGK